MLRARESTYLNELDDLRARLNNMNAIVVSGGCFSSTQNNSSDLISFESAESTLIVTTKTTTTRCGDDDDDVMQSCLTTMIQQQHQEAAEDLERSTSVVVHRPLLDATLTESDDYKARYFELREGNHTYIWCNFFVVDILFAFFLAIDTFKHPAFTQMQADMEEKYRQVRVVCLFVCLCGAQYQG